MSAKKDRPKERPEDKEKQTTANAIKQVTELPCIISFDNKAFSSMEDGISMNNEHIKESTDDLSPSPIRTYISGAMHPRTVILMIALSADCVFEGIALGRCRKYNTFV